ncbi:serine hydrolase domain-containing protein [Saccharothrix violaceirubra]|uniref:CubicO group peptidase (Beta-lactamase class C family) n=1 Tax=Saccharothrix violaceirubra TaxID=413306 RepID=A0A7W7WYV2_9PSEU|nr:serine hydrolase domain-containing protein [Saccharothrix violaceirubra]MBB4968929.1 CubicO group peptidase (beta-lactamase class C family) [Saccharothrix violaceirubra]
MKRLLALLLAMATITAGSAAATSGDGRYDHPRTGWMNAVLHDGFSPVDRTPIEKALRHVRALPNFPGAVTLLAHDGVIVAEEAAGWAVRYADAKTELPPDRRVPMTVDTVFDLASISKLFTSIVVMRQYELGRIDLDAAVSRYLPEFGVNGKADITVKQLLTHTSGLVDWLPLWSDYPDVPARIKAVMDTRPTDAPGTGYRYSDLNLITLGLLAERVSGTTLDVLVDRTIATPLGLKDTGYRPKDKSRTAATEFQAGRGMVRGEVHDENAWSLGGVAGHSGVFSTARELATVGQMILNGGRYRGVEILERDTVTLMLTDFNSRFPGDAHGLGFELDQNWYMGALSSPGTAGHTGFSGTSLVLDPLSGSIAVLLTNRVHPDRNRGSINPSRRAVADGLAQALAVRPVAGKTSWAAERDGGTLTTRVLPAQRHRLEFAAFVDLAAGEEVAVQAFTDDQWRDLRKLTGYGTRRWQRIVVEAEATRFRWRYTAGTGPYGRGVHVDAVRVTDRRGQVLDSELSPDGWRIADR